MRKILFVLAAIMITLSASAKSANDTTVVFKISPKMVCTNCENKIKNNIRYEKGVSAIEATAPGENVSVTYDKSKTSADKIITAFKKIGYEAEAGGKCQLIRKSASEKACLKAEPCKKAGSCVKDSVMKCHTTMQKCAKETEKACCKKDSVKSCCKK
jgi:copper chaperone CopZ